MTRTTLDISKIGWVGPLSVVASVVAVQAVRIIAVAALNPKPSFTPLGWAFPVIDTAILTSGAVLIFGAIASAASRPIRTFRRVASVVLVFSIIPALATAKATNWGGSWANSTALVLMHVAAWWVSVTMLTRLTVRKSD